jgi:hypothetical protein
MMTTPAGWYPDPRGPGQRYFDGANWTEHSAAASTPAVAPPMAAVIEGPNHALHAILTLFTFWACGGWAWVWLIIAINNKKTVRVIR